MRNLLAFFLILSVSGTAALAAPTKRAAPRRSGAPIVKAPAVKNSPLKQQMNQALALARGGQYEQA
ncbi:MAG: hypothetical protein H7326_04965, partial [Bdellovibrionaceae bacterium]|nr:hypothetical protein [Pseudobdellovibrionaceae bacterium]